ncbi:MAG: TetR/AcrR family transcriptional regulator [Syntrophales bacterium]|nr:TetR/AcrR family transcriptional regulator [Syntrophales bacterium]
MGRIAHFKNEQFMDAALKIAAGQGPAAVTIAAIAGVVGAPVGSVYHRFQSRDMLLAEVWLRVVSSFQKAFLPALEQGEGLAAALHTSRWVRQHPAEARILLLYRREELVAGDWPHDLKERALRIKEELDRGIRDYVGRTFGENAPEEALGRTHFALIDVPYAAVIRYIRQGKEPPMEVDGYIRQTYSIIMGRER